MRIFKGFIVAMISIVLLVGCDSSLEVVSMEISKYPDRIVYYIGVDEELDLTGGLIIRTTKSGNVEPESMEDIYFEVSHEIDFNNPGVYVVEIQSGDFTCKFPIQVLECGE